ncbi:ABC transporter C-terminal domain-containing protein [Gemmiger formicilis]|uniref:ABC transporter C-terminal domain-containing protein n=1 Tax=Gemmiger formicilis TaxID=745368 RepID=UPI003F9D3DD4
MRARLKAVESEIEELGAHIVELENEINDPEVLRDHLLLRDKCDELDDSLASTSRSCTTSGKSWPRSRTALMQKVIAE